MSWDLGLIELDSARNLDGVPFAFMAEQIAAQHRRGGINAISWHPVNPSSRGNSWDVSTAPLRQLASDKALADTLDTDTSGVEAPAGAFPQIDGFPRRCTVLAPPEP